MNRDQMFELRVLTGTHAGARALLPDAPQVLGSGDDCDLILSDEGVQERHARLEQREDGTTVLHWLEGDLPPLVIHPGEGVRIGSVEIAVEPLDAPWRDDVTSCDAGHPAPALAPAGPASPDEARIDEAMDSTRPAPATAAPAGGALRDGSRLARVPGWLILAVAAIAAAGWLTSRWMAQPATPEPTGGSSTAVGSPGLPTGTNDILAAIRRLGLSDRAEVSMNAARQPVVRAFLLSEEEAESLASALAQLTPRPGLQLTDEQDLLVAVTDTLQRYAGGGRTPLTARYMGDASFRLEGRVTDELQKQALLATMRERFPQVRTFDASIQTDTGIADGLLEALRRRYGGEIQGAWADGTLSLELTLARAEVLRWEQVLQAVAADYPVPLRARLHVIEPQEPPAVRLPFSVRTVAGTDPPYVLLDTGEKLTIDGSIGGWRVVQINAKAVVFESLRGRRITLER